MGMPLVGIGLLYRQGYFSQTIDDEGNQGATYADSDFSELPVELVTVDGGADLRVKCRASGAQRRAAGLARLRGPRQAPSARYRRAGER